MFDAGFEESGDWQNARKAFRASRGMMELAIFAALSELPMHGYEVISYIEKRSQGFWRFGPGRCTQHCSYSKKKILLRIRTMMVKKYMSWLHSVQLKPRQAEIT